MRTNWFRGVGLAAVFAGVVGCASSGGPNVRTPMPEQYTLPPADDSRFTQPVSYPKEVLNQEPIKPASPGKQPGQQGPIMPAGGMGRGMTPGGF